MPSSCAGTSKKENLTLIYCNWLRINSSYWQNGAFIYTVFLPSSTMCIFIKFRWSEDSYIRIYCVTGLEAVLMLYCKCSTSKFKLTSLFKNILYKCLCCLLIERDLILTQWMVWEYDSKFTVLSEWRGGGVVCKLSLLY